MRSKAVIAILALVVEPCSTGLWPSQANSLKELAKHISDFYDESYPPQHVRPNMHHSKRCSLQNPESAVAAYKDHKWQSFSKGFDIFITTPCIGFDSLGNYLGNYFETLLCAQSSGLHFVTVAKVWQPADKDRPSAFISNLPSFVENQSPVSSYENAVSRMSQYCKCHAGCHERSNALWISFIPEVISLLRSALCYHIQQDTTSLFKYTQVTSNDYSTVTPGTILPFVPDVAVHYRCGDNFVGHYGFVPFSAFKTLIPPTARTVYILSEAKGRKTTHKKHLEKKCDLILDGLFRYLVKAFPSTTILLRRGDDLYVDFARLAYSNTLICSVSTFCLWPAIMSNGTSAHFPLTRLVASGNSSVNLGQNFHWLERPAVVKGAPYEHTPAKEFLRILDSN